MNCKNYKERMSNSMVISIYFYRGWMFKSRYPILKKEVKGDGNYDAWWMSIKMTAISLRGDFGRREKAFE